MWLQKPCHAHILWGYVGFSHTLLAFLPSMVGVLALRPWVLPSACLANAIILLTAFCLFGCSQR